MKKINIAINFGIFLNAVGLVIGFTSCSGNSNKSVNHSEVDSLKTKITLEPIITIKS